MQCFAARGRLLLDLFPLRLYSGLLLELSIELGQLLLDLLHLLSIVLTVLLVLRQVVLRCLELPLRDLLRSPAPIYVVLRSILFYLFLSQHLVKEAAGVVRVAVELLLALPQLLPARCVVLLQLRNSLVVEDLDRCGTSLNLSFQLPGPRLRVCPLLGELLTLLGAQLQGLLGSGEL